MTNIKWPLGREYFHFSLTNYPTRAISYRNSSRAPSFTVAAHQSASPIDACFFLFPYIREGYGPKAHIPA